MIEITIQILDRSIIAMLNVPEDQARNTVVTLDFEEGSPTDSLGLNQAIGQLTREVVRNIAKD